MADEEEKEEQSSNGLKGFFERYSKMSDLTLSSWGQYKRRILMPVALSSIASFVLLLGWLAFALPMLISPILLGIAGLATLGFLTGWGLDRKYIQAYREENKVKLHFSAFYVERALPILVQPSSALYFPVERLYTQQEVESLLNDSNYKADINRTPWSYVQLKEGQDPLTYRVDTLKEEIGATPAKLFPDAGLRPEEGDALAILAHYLDRSFIQGGFTGLCNFILSGFFKCLVAEPPSILVSGRVAVEKGLRSSFGQEQRNIIIRLKPPNDSYLLLKNKVIFFAGNQDEPEGSLPIMQLLCTRQITLKREGGFSYRTVQLEVTMEKAFWEALVEDSHQTLHNLNAWTDGIIVAFVPMLQDPGLAAAFREKLKTSPLTEVQAGLLSDCYERCFGYGLNFDLSYKKDLIKGVSSDEFKPEDNAAKPVIRPGPTTPGLNSLDSGSPTPP